MSGSTFLCSFYSNNSSWVISCKPICSYFSSIIFGIINKRVELIMIHGGPPPPPSWHAEHQVTPINIQITKCHVKELGRNIQRPLYIIYHNLSWGLLSQPQCHFPLLTPQTAAPKRQRLVLMKLSSIRPTFPQSPLVLILSDSPQTPSQPSNHI